MRRTILIAFFAFLSLETTHGAGTTISPGCGSAPADIHFLLDSSGSVGTANFQKQKDFVAKFAQTFDIGPRNVQIGVTTFSTSVHQQFFMNAHGDKASLVKAIQNIPYQSGSTYTDKAIHYVAQNAFTKAHGDRDHVVNILITMTDGQSNNKPATITESNALHKLPVESFAIGIGRGINKDELNHIASDNTKVFTVSNFNALNTIQAELRKTACEVDGKWSRWGTYSPCTKSCGGGTHFRQRDCNNPPPSNGGKNCVGPAKETQACNAQACPTTPPPTTPPPTTRPPPTTTNSPGCGTQPADIVFILDSSGSVGTTNFGKMKDFVKTMVNGFDISPTTTEVSVITFSDKPHLEFHLNKYHDKASAATAVSNVRYIQGGTNTADALKYARETSFTNANGARNNAAKIAIVITDGKSNNNGATANEANLLRNAGVTVFSIGVGSGPKVSELNQMATDPDNQHVFVVNNFDALKQIKGELAQKACEVKATIAAPTPNRTDCGAKADIVFLLDSSGSVGQTNFNKMLNFVQDITKNFKVGPNDVQVGVDTFQTTHKAEFNMNKYQDNTALQNAIKGIHYHGGSTHTGEAIQFLHTNSFSTAAGNRPNVPDVAIVVTDGNSNNRQLTASESAKARKDGIKMFAIGVGNGINSNELNAIASDPDSQYVFKADNFDALSSLKGVLSSKACEISNHTAPPKPQNCGAQADIVFMLDSSGSVGKPNYDKMLSFVKSIVKDFPIASDKIRVGMEIFSSRPYQVFNLNKYHDMTSLTNAIDHVPYKSGGTNTGAALNTLYSKMFTTANGDRPGVPNIAIVVTDGRSNNHPNTVKEASNARNHNINIFSVGVGSGVDTNELKDIATDPDNTHVMTVTDFSKLSQIKALFTQRACAAIPATLPPYTPTAAPPMQTDPCQDKLANCASYKAQSCAGLYTSWAKENCARFCGYCATAIPTTPAPCLDRLANCKDYDPHNCQTYAPWAHDNCRKFCGFCQPDSKGSTGYYGMCSYNGKTYTQGQTWDDGCAYECTCDDAARGKYSCYNKCPSYYNLPPQCTLAKKAGECCLQPVCNFNPTYQTTTGQNVGTQNGINVCVYQGKKYYQGQAWSDGCDFECQCVDAGAGMYSCQSTCAQYNNLPAGCRLEKQPGKCCSVPTCDFNKQYGQFTGIGGVSGKGVGAVPTNPPPCVDKLPNCNLYQQDTCTSTQYKDWALVNCPKHCNFCNLLNQPKQNEVCVYKGTVYQQGQTWYDGCDYECLCENAKYGYYRCNKRCPDYINLPLNCQAEPVTGQCCKQVKCTGGQGTFIGSSTIPGSSGSYPVPNLMPQATYAPGIVPTYAPGKTYAPGMIPTPAPGKLFAPNMIPTPAPGQTYAPGMYPTLAPGMTYAPNMIYSPVPQQTYAPGMMPTYAPAMTYAPGMIPTPAPGKLFAPGMIPTPAPGQTYAPGMFPTLAPGQTYAPNMIYTPPATYAPGIVPTYAPGKTYAPGMIPTPAPGKLFAPNMIPTPAPGQTYAPGMVPTLAPGQTYAPNMIYTPPQPTYAPGIVPTYAPGKTFAPGMIPTPAPGKLFAPNMIPTPAPGQTYAPGMVPTLAPGQTYAPNMIYTPGPTYAPGIVPTYAPGKTFAPGMIPTPAPGKLFAPNMIPTPAPGQTYAPGMVPTLAPGQTYAPNMIYTPGPTYAPGIVPTYAPGKTYAPGMIPTPAPGKLFAPNMIPTPAPGQTYAPGMFPTLAPGQTYAPNVIYTPPKPTYAPGIVPTYAPGKTYAPGMIPTPAPGKLFAPNMIPTPAPGQTYAPGMFPTLAPGQTYAPNMIYTPGPTYAPGVVPTYAPALTYAPGMIPTPQPGKLFAPGMIPTPAPGQTYAPGMIPTLAPGQTYAPGVVYVPQPTYAPGMVPTYAPGKTYAPGMIPTPAPGQLFKPNMIPTPAPGQTYAPGMNPTLAPGMTYPANMIYSPPTPGVTYAPGIVPTYAPGKTYAPGMIPTPAPGKLFAPNMIPTPAPGMTYAPGMIPTLAPGQTYAPNMIYNPNATPQPQPNLVPKTIPGCYVNGSLYQQGQRWLDGCDYTCMCDDAQAGHFSCQQRCPTFQSLPAGCTLQDSPSDPCCKTPVCPAGTTNVPVPSYGPGISGYGQAKQPTGSGTGTIGTGPSGSGQPSTFVNGNGGGTSGSRTGCLYNGKLYTQGQTWDDGCKARCTCEDAAAGRYQCTDRCPNYNNLPQQCRLVPDPNDACCQTYRCDFSTQTTLPPLFARTTPVSGGAYCLYKGQYYHQGEEWNDGCSSKCRCEDAVNHFYQCSERCSKFSNIPLGCTYVADPNDPQCCRIPQCTVTGSVGSGTSGTSSGQSPTGYTGSITGYGRPQPGTANFNPNITTTGYSKACIYKGSIYTQGQQWQDGCTYDCECLDANTGRYRCTDRCTKYANIPSNCQMVTDPNDQCCKKPVCTPTGPQTCADRLPDCSSYGSYACKAPYDGWAKDNCKKHCGFCGATGTATTASTSTVCDDKIPNCKDYGQQACTGQYTGWARDRCAKFCGYCGVTGAVSYTQTAGNGSCSDVLINCQEYTTSACGGAYENWARQNCKKFCGYCNGGTGIATGTGGGMTGTGTGGTGGTGTGSQGSFSGYGIVTQQPGSGFTGFSGGCFYKNQLYQQGQQWEDGCDYNCTCTNAQTGYYTCRALCATWTNLPQGCTLVKPPGECCSKPSCTGTGSGTGSGTGGSGTFTGQTNVCLYKGQTYQQGQTWDDGCEFKCTCADASQGRYTCNNKCVQWNLPNVCTLEPPAAGKCCKTPKCPSYVVINYPPGYTQE